MKNFTRIAIYKSKDFTKKGLLKKNANPEYITEKEKIDAREIADYIKYLGYKDFKTPYFFTHIEANSPYDSQPVKIFQDVIINGNKFITTPKELAIYLA